MVKLTAALVILTTTGNIFGHASGKSFSVINIYQDSIVLNVDCNTSDITNGAGIVGYGNNVTEIDIIRLKLRDYFFARMPISIGGAASSDMYVSNWKRDGKGPDDLLMPEDLKDTSVIFNIVYPRTADAEFFTFTNQAFAEYGILAISNTRVYWKGELVNHTLLALDNTISIPLDSASLQARILQEKERLKPPVQKITGGIGNLIKNGLNHVLPLNLTHIFMMFGVVLIAYNFKWALGGVLLFTLGNIPGHYMGLPSSFITPGAAEAMVALLLVLCGVASFVEKTTRWPLMVTLLVLGVFHGLGYAESTLIFGLTSDAYMNLVWGSNIGLFLGHLLALCVAAGVVALVNSKPGVRKVAHVTLSAIVFISGVFGVIQGFLN